MTGLAILLLLELTTGGALADDAATGRDVLPFKARSSLLMAFRDRRQMFKTGSFLSGRTGQRDYSHSVGFAQLAAWGVTVEPFTSYIVSGGVAGAQVKECSGRLERSLDCKLPRCPTFSVAGLAVGLRAPVDLQLPRSSSGMGGAPSLRQIREHTTTSLSQILQLTS